MLIGIFYSQIVERSSLVSVLFREDLSHPYISFFHLLVNGFSVIIRIINFKIISSISSDEIPPRSACKCLPNLVAIHLKYVLLVLL